MIFKLVFLPEYCFEFVLQGLLLKFSNFTALLLLESYFSSIQWFSVLPELELTESAVGLAMPRKPISYFFNSTSFIFPLTIQSIGCFWSRFFNPKIRETCLLHRTWSPDWPNVAKVFIVLSYLDTPTRFSRKQHFWIRRLRSELAVTSSWTFLRWNKIWLCPIDWNVDNLNLQKVSIIVVSMPIFKNDYSLKKSAWIFSTRSPSEKFWSSLASV